MKSMSLTKKQIIEQLGLEAHPLEGGYFCRTYTSDLDVTVPYDSLPRKTLSSIYYLLTDDRPVALLHKNRSDIVHYYHGGSPLTYLIVHPSGELEKVIMGHDLSNGEQLQLIVKGGCWKASLLQAGEYGLISEAVSPGFEYTDNELVDRDSVDALFPELWEDLKSVVKIS